MDLELKFILESILFSAQQPMSPKELKGVLNGALEHSEEPGVKKLKRTSLDTITQTLDELRVDLSQTKRSYHLVCVAGAWQFVSKTEYAPWIKALVGHRSRPPRLSQPALETLAIIAYRQPLTRSEIEQVRGVAVDGVMHTLTERGLVLQLGRAEVPGRPMTYGTSPLFLEYFGLANLDELPVADELRRIPIEKPEGLLTVDPGLATTPPDDLNGDGAKSEDPEKAGAEDPSDQSDQPGAKNDQDNAAEENDGDEDDEDDDEEEYDDDEEDEEDDDETKQASTAADNS